jgi:nitronate monooxygenase
MRRLTSKPIGMNALIEASSPKYHQRMIAVNSRAGGHAGPKSPELLLEEMGDLGVPLVCAGGIGTKQDFVRVLRMGYTDAQLGTRFIATTECRASAVYKQAIVNAKEEDIVLSERISGVPVAVINTPYIRRTGLKAGPLARWMLRGRRTKKWMRSFYGIKSVWQLKRASLDESGEKDYWQAGKSVAGIDRIEPAGEIVRRFVEAARRG